MADSPDSQGSKRKRDDAAGQKRAKRNRYISIACNECKRRKIKCNGNQPCARCGNLNLECVYAPNCCGTNFKDSDEWKHMTTHIASLQDQVDALYANVSSLRSELSQNNSVLDPSLQSTPFVGSSAAAIGTPQQAQMLAQVHDRNTTPAPPPPPTFRGPTSSAFSFDVAKSTLHTMGIASEAQPGEEDGGTADGSPTGSPRPVYIAPPPKSHKDPIWVIPRADAMRLLGVYEEETHQMYPVMSVDHVRAHAVSLYRFLDVLRPAITRPGLEGADAIYDDDTNILKLTIAIALVVEGKGRSEMGQRLFAAVQPHVDMLLLGNAGMKQIRLLALTAIYEFHSDNESTAWRVIGLTARLAIELGLHRKETYEKMPAEERELSILLFWSIYTLDRRWSFGTGMPFALQDSDIDPQLPRPGDKSPYLTAMIDYCAIGSKVWQAIGADHSNPGANSVITRDNISYLDFQVRQWHRSLPDHLRFDNRDMSLLDERKEGGQSRTNMRLSIILYLRQNSMLIQIYRPVLHSATNIMKNQAQAQEVVNVAMDTIRILTRINQTSGMYQVSQVLFNAFLTSALAVLFLAVSHAPAAFSVQVREEFYLALELVRGFSKGSYVSKRLWKTIRVLKEVAPKLGLVNSSSGPDADNEDPSRSAALAMAGLAGHNVDGFAYGQQQQQQTPQGWPTTPGTHLASPDNMANDLTRLFEAAGSYDPNGANGAGFASTPQIPGDSSMESAFAGEDELGRIMRDLF